MGRKQTLLAIAFCVIVCCLGGWLYISLSSPPINLQEAYRNYPSDILGITEPVDLVQSFAWEDGGTINLVLKDANGTKLLACLDGRDMEGPYRDLFFGADHPDHAGAYSVGVAGPEETALFAVLVRYFDVHPIDPNEKLPLSRPQWYQRFAKGFMNALERRLRSNRIDRRPIEKATEHN